MKRVYFKKFFVAFLCISMLAISAIIFGGCGLSENTKKENSADNSLSTDSTGKALDEWGRHSYENVPASELMGSIDIEKIHAIQLSIGDYGYYLNKGSDINSVMSAISNMYVSSSDIRPAEGCTLSYNLILEDKDYNTIASMSIFVYANGKAYWAPSQHILGEEFNPFQEFVINESQIVQILDTYKK